MKAAQIALAALIGLVLAGGVVLIVLDHTVAGWVFSIFGMFGVFVWLLMVVNDGVQRSKLPPPPGR